MTFSVTPSSPDPTGLTPSSSSPDAPALTVAADAPDPTALAAAVTSAPALDFSAAAIAQTRVSLEEFIQWMTQGTALGDRRVEVVDFVDPTLQKLEVTRGIGENRHVLTLRFLQQALYFTSWPYPAEVGADMDLGLILPMGGYMLEAFNERMDVGLVLPMSGSLISVLAFYALWPAETLNAEPPLPQSGTLVSILQQYTFWPAEAMNSEPPLPQSGTLVVVLVSYTNWPAETLDIGLCLPQSGTLV